MARNEEKQYGRLNRMLLQEQKEEQLAKHPPRPQLCTIHTAAELRRWLPTVTRDMEFYLKQSEVPCYPPAKIAEFAEKLKYLQRQYRAFLRKLRDLDPYCKNSDWQTRPYKRTSGEDTGNGRKIVKIGCLNIGEVKASLSAIRQDTSRDTCHDDTDDVIKGVAGVCQCQTQTTDCKCLQKHDLRRLELPVLNDECQSTVPQTDTSSQFFSAVITNSPPQGQDEPLQFTREYPSVRSQIADTENNVLGISYESSSDEEVDV